MAAERPANPYVGPRPFERDDAPRFFGRAREVRDVVSLVVAQRVLLLYSASGAGKSSLLNAGALPVLEDEKGFDVLPVGRLQTDDPAADRNVFVACLVASLDGSEARLADALEQRPKTAATRLRVLVIDQFEELFTLHPGRWREQPGLFEQLSEALARDPGLRLVLAIREDFVAQLDPFASMLAGGLRTRFRLERLDRGSALAAVRNPLEGTGRSFAPGVAEALVDDLLRFRVDTGHGENEEVEGQYVEPVQLQVACRSLWSELPPEIDDITAEHVRTYADVEQVLTRFYDEAVAAASGRSRRRERRIREWVDRVLITSGGTRGAAYAGAAETAGMSNDVVRVLEDKRVIRAEWRAGARWYELTHDRLIEPIRRSNERYFARRRKRLIAGVAVAAVAALTVLATVAGFSLGSNERASEFSISALQIQPAATWGAFQQRAGIHQSRRPEGTRGIIVEFRVDAMGFKDIPIQVEARLVDFRSPLETRTNITMRSELDSVTVPRLIWLDLPHPPVGDPFAVYLTAISGDPARLLDETNSFVFIYATEDKVCTQYGSPHADSLRGGAGADALCGLGGPDAIVGGRGDDLLLGADGFDRIDGGPGNDIVEGDAGNDILYGGRGRDFIEGGPGADEVHADDGQPDVVDGGSGNDVASVDPIDVVRNVERIRR